MRQSVNAKQICFAIVIFLAALWFAYQIFGVVSAPHFGDFDTVYTAAQAIANGKDPYDVQGLLQTPFASHYKYPPFLAATMSLFLNVGLNTLVWTFVCTSLLLYAVSYVLMLRIVEFPLLSWPAGILAIAFMVWQPSIDTL